MSMFKKDLSVDLKNEIEAQKKTLNEEKKETEPEKPKTIDTPVFEPKSEEVLVLQKSEQSEDFTPETIGTDRNLMDTPNTPSVTHEPPNPMQKVIYNMPINDDIPIRSQRKVSNKKTIFKIIKYDKKKKEKKKEVIEMYINTK